MQFIKIKKVYSFVFSVVFIKNRVCTISKSFWVAENEEVVLKQKYFKYHSLSQSFWKEHIHFIHILRAGWISRNKSNPEWMFSFSVIF